MKDLSNAARLVQVIFSIWNFTLEREGLGPDQDIDPNAEITIREDSDSDEPVVQQGRRQKRKTKDYISRKYFS